MYKPFILESNLKIYATIAALLVSSSAFAGATGGFTTADAGIVTPDVAVGMRSYEYFTFTENTGEMVVCDGDNYSRGKCDGGWKTLQSVTPARRQVVGFRIVSGPYGYRRLEVYWK